MKIKLNSVNLINIEVTDQNDNHLGVFSFIPDDVMVRERALNFSQNIVPEIKKKYDEKLKDVKTEEDHYSWIGQINEEYKKNIDLIWGEGTSEKAFGKVNTPEMIPEFLNGIMAVYKEEQKKAINKYKK